MVNPNSNWNLSPGLTLLHLVIYLIIEELKSIYIDYQSTTPVAPSVLEEMLPYFKEKFGNPHSADHVMGWHSSQAVEHARSSVAELVGGSTEEIIFTSGATEANNQVFSTVLDANHGPRKRILISSVEHKCVIEAASYFARTHGCVVDVVPVLPSGLLDLQALECLLDDDVLLVSVIAVNNEMGVIQPIQAIAELVHAHGALMHTDAAQAPEAIEIDVDLWGVDFLSLSAHKIYGPKGIGALYINASMQAVLPPFVHGGGQQNGLRSGTVPTPLCVGFGAAAKLLLEEAHKNRSHLKAMSELFLGELSTRGVDFIVNGDQVHRHPGNLNLCFDGIDASSLIATLQPTLCVSTGSACNSGLIEPSYVLTAMGLTEELANSSIRFSFGRFNYADQVKVAADKIASAIKVSRQNSH